MNSVQTPKDEIGANLARVYNEAKFSHIYFDGNECQSAPFGAVLDFRLKSALEDVPLTFMPLLLRLNGCRACDQWHSSLRCSLPLAVVDTVNSVQTLKVLVTWHRRSGDILNGTRWWKPQPLHHTHGTWMLEAVHPTTLPPIAEACGTSVLSSILHSMMPLDPPMPARLKRACVCPIAFLSGGHSLTGRNCLLRPNTERVV
jgi:hypothetical protein